MYSTKRTGKLSIRSIWILSTDFGQSHAGLVCLCGRTIQDNLELFLVDRSLSIEAWHKYPAQALYETISRYNTFDSMINSLVNLKADPAITLLRRRFLGYLDDVGVTDDERPSADLLTSEGVLLKTNPDQLYYRMSSPLVDGLIRTIIIALSNATAFQTAVIINYASSGYKFCLT